MQGFFETIENGIRYRYIHLESGLWKKIKFETIIKQNDSLLNEKTKKSNKIQKNLIKNLNSDNVSLLIGSETSVKQKHLEKFNKIQNLSEKKKKSSKKKKLKTEQFSLNDSSKSRLFNQKFSIEEHSKHTKKLKPDNLTDSQKWWRSLTLEQQAKWRYNLMLKKKGTADYQFELEQCKKEGHYKK